MNPFPVCLGYDHLQDSYCFYPMYPFLPLLLQSLNSPFSSCHSPGYLHGTFCNSQSCKTCITPFLASTYLFPLWLPVIGLPCLATLVQHTTALKWLTLLTTLPKTLITPVSSCFPSSGSLSVTGSHMVQAGLELAIFLPPKYWDYRCRPLRSTSSRPGFPRPLYLKLHLSAGLDAASLSSHHLEKQRQEDHCKLRAQPGLLKSLSQSKQAQYSDTSQ